MKPRKLPTITEIWNVTWASVVAVLAVEHVFIGPLWQRIFAASALVSLIAFGSTLVLAFVTIWRNARKAQSDLPVHDLRKGGGPDIPAPTGPVRIVGGDDEQGGGSIVLQAGEGGRSDSGKGGSLEIQGGNSMPPDRGGTITLTAGKMH